MRHLLALPLLAALALPLTGCFERGHDKDKHCHDPAPTTAGTVGKLAAGQWVLIDRTNGTETYNPQGPGGWVRNTFVFAADGTVVATAPGPTDLPVNTAGTWNQQGDDVHIMLPQSTILPAHLTWRLQSLSATELKVTVQ